MIDIVSIMTNPWVLAAAIVATFLGGFTSVWFCWDKITAWFRRTRARQTLPKFAPGQWISDGRTNTLVIAPDLSWKWTSTHQGQWSGSGRGEIRDGHLVLHGRRVGTTSQGSPAAPGPMTMRLKRERERLEGPLTSPSARTWDMIFFRDESARAE
jgi:hypothetical protein